MAVEASTTRVRQDRTCDRIDVLDTTSFRIHAHLRADLEARDEVLVHETVEHEPALHGVGGQEEYVYVHQQSGGPRIDDVAGDGLEPDIGVRLPSYPLRDLDLVRRARCERVPTGRADDTGKVCEVDAIRIDRHDVADPEMGDHLRDERPTPTYADDPDLEPP